MTLDELAIRIQELQEQGFGSTPVRALTDTTTTYDIEDVEADEEGEVLSVIWINLI